MFISGLIIVKNAESTIGRAIGSLKAVSDEIIVLDTGSEDSTPGTATSAGASVFFTSWEDDFSKARNEAIGYCRGDIIVTIDADEQLVAIDRSKLEEYFDADDVGGLICTLVNDLERGTINSKHTYTRVFRRVERIRYVGSIHEQIRPSIEAAGYKVVESDVTINHSGYSEKSKEKIERNRKLLKKELKKGEDSFVEYHLAETEFAAGNIDEAKKLFEKSKFSSDLSIDQKEIIRLRLAQIALKTSDMESIRDNLDFISSDEEREGFRKYILAACEMEEGNYSQALNLYEDKKVNSSGMVDSGMVSKAISALKSLLGRT